MLTQICQYLRNWFERDKLLGNFAVENGILTYADGSALPLLNGQYFRIIGSLLNDGVHKLGADGDALTDEPEFSGAVWSMAVPPDVAELDAEMSQWQEKYGSASSAAMSPFASESFGGYSYSKSFSGGSSSGSGSGGAASVFDVFAGRLAPWRKI